MSVEPGARPARVRGAPRRDANYGYRGFYVDRDDYNYYFREGFGRGYEDAYYRRSRYGPYSDGRGTIQGHALTVILAFEWIR